MTSSVETASFKIDGGSTVHLKRSLGRSTIIPMQVIKPKNLSTMRNFKPSKMLSALGRKDSLEEKKKKEGL